MRRSGVVVLAIGLAATACSLITSLDGYADGTQPGADASAPDDAGGSTDATASLDALPSVDAAAGCASLSPAPFFCADFDDGKKLTDIFEAVDVTTGGAASIDGALSASPPNSLLFTYDVPTGQFAHACVKKTIPANVTRVTVDVDLDLEQQGAGDTLDMLSFTKSGIQELQLEISTSGTLRIDPDYPVDGGQAGNPIEVAALIPTGWVHLTWDIGISGDRETSRITLGGVDRSTFPTTTAAVAGSTLFVGDCSVNDLSTPWRLRLDNLVVRTQ